MIVHTATKLSLVRITPEEQNKLMSKMKSTPISSQCQVVKSSTKLINCPSDYN